MLNLSLSIHVLAVILWLGGMMFFTLVLAPYIRSMEDKETGRKIFKDVATRFKTFGWIALALIFVTGPLNLELLGINHDTLKSADFYTTSMGVALKRKFGLIAVLVTSIIVHDFYLGPKARKNPKFMVYAKIFGRFNLVLAILIVIMAVMVRTGV